jgi:WD40 repeat protein
VSAFDAIVIAILIIVHRACKAILQGHTSLVGQLQMRGNTLVTGGSDGSVRVWSLEKMVPIHRLAAHDNSVTSLQFDDCRVVSGGSDGRVKIWDLKSGHLVRELTQPADAVWRVAFEEEKCVVMASRQSRTIMEVCDTSLEIRNSLTKLGLVFCAKIGCYDRKIPAFELTR